MKVRCLNHRAKSKRTIQSLVFYAIHLNYGSKFELTENMYQVMSIEIEGPLNFEHSKGERKLCY